MFRKLLHKFSRNQFADGIFRPRSATLATRLVERIAAFLRPAAFT